MTLDECITEYEQMVLASKGLRQTEAYNYGSQMLDWLKELRAWRQAFSKAKYTEITNEEALKILKEYHNMDSDVESEYMKAVKVAINVLEKEVKANDK